MAETQPPQGDFPPVHPSGTDQTVFTRPDWLLRLPNFLLQLIEKIVGLVVQAITGVFLPGPLGSAFNQLVNWAESILPDMILDPVRQLVQILIDALNLIPIFGPLVAGPVEYFANIIGLLNDKSDAAQASADTAQETAETAQGTANQSAEDTAVTTATSESTGALIIDRFTGAAATSLGANWTQTYESGSGTLGLDGNGNAIWNKSGGDSRYGRARYSATALSSDVQKAQIIVNAKFAGYSTNPEIWILLRVDSTLNNFVSARLYSGGCEIGYMVSNSYTRLGSVVSVTHAAGDKWEFRAGTTAGDYEFKLFQNGNLRVTQTDSGHVSQKGASYRYSGVRVRAGQQVVYYQRIQQPHPPMAVFTAIDYTP